MDLKNKTAMITGGASGLGAALARRFAEEGAAISICGRHLEALKGPCEEIRALDGRCLAVAADIRHPQEIHQWIDLTKAEFGPIDVFVNNASILGERVSVEDYPLDTWREVLDVNLTGAFLCAQAIAPELRETQGSLINVSSGVGDHGRPYWGAYCVAKNGLEAISEMMAGELEEAGVRVNTVDPGSMRTSMRASAYPDEDPDTLPDPYEVTDVFVYLASDRSAQVTGNRFRAKEFETAIR